MGKDALPWEGKDTQLKDPRDFALGLSDQGLSLLSWAPRAPPRAVFIPLLPFFSTLITTCCDMPSAHKVLLPEPCNPAIMVWWEGHLTWEPGGVLPHPSPLGWLCLWALVALSVNMDIRGIAHGTWSASQFPIPEATTRTLNAAFPCLPSRGFRSFLSQDMKFISKLFCSICWSQKGIDENPWPSFTLLSLI